MPLTRSAAKSKGWRPAPAPLRHPMSPLPLLPSGPDGVHGLSSRRNRREPPLTWRREWDSNPRTPVKMLLEFQSSAFDRSAIPPHDAPPANMRAGAQRTRGTCRVQRGSSRLPGPLARHSCLGLSGLAGLAGVSVRYWGGSSRQPPVAVRGASGALTSGIASASLLSGASRPGGILSRAIDRLDS